MNINIPEKFWKVATVFLIVLTVAAAIATIGVAKSIGYVGVNRNQTNTVSVDGTGDAYAVPDVATFSFTVSDTEKAVADAQTKATDKINAALKVVRASGVADKDIQTQYYSIEPQYQYQNAVCPMASPADSAVSSSGMMIPTYCPPGKQTLTGYTVSESVTVKLRDLSKAGALLVSLGSAGVSDLNGPSFAVDDPNAVQDQARTKAIADAKSKASELAKELGVHIVRVTSFTEGNNGVIRPVMYAMNGSVGAAAPKAAPEVPTGQQKVTDNVTITYEIK